MMLDRLSPREQRLAAVFLLLLAAALAWWGVIRPIAGGFAGRADRRDLLLAQWQRDERIVGQLPSLTRAIAAQRAQATLFRLPVASEEAAAGLLNRRLQAAVAIAGGASDVVESIAAPPGTVRARLACKLDPARLAAFAQALQNGSPVLLVDGLAIDATTPAGGPHPGLVDVQVDVSAFYSATSPR